MSTSIHLTSVLPRRAAAAALVAAALAGGCWSDERPTRWERERAVIGPIALKAHIAYVDTGLDRVTLLDVSAPEPRVAHVAIGRRASAAVPTPDRHGLLVLTRGEEAVARGEVDEAPALWAIDATGSEPPRRYAIGSPFDRLAISPDGRIAIAYFSAAGPAGGVLQNPNELAVIQLREPPGPGNPQSKTIRAYGAVPDGIALSPPLVVPGAADGAPRTIAFVLAADTLTVLDATHPTRREISIRLDLAGPPVVPREVVFAPGTASAYVRSDGAADVLHVRLQGAVPAQPDANDFAPELAQLGAGGAPTDLAVYDDAFGRRLLLASTPGTRELLVIDAATAQFRALPLADPIDRILLFPGGPRPPTTALLASVGSKLARVHVLDLDRVLDPLTAPRLRRVEVSRPIRDVVPVPGRALAMLVHDDARTVLGLLDLATESTAPLLGVGQLDAYDFTPEGDHLIGVTAGVPRVGVVDLATLHPTDVRLDAPPGRVLTTARGAIVVDHGDPLGRATLLPSATASRADARELTGFLVADLLSEER